MTNSTPSSGQQVGEPRSTTMRVNLQDLLKYGVDQIRPSPAELLHSKHLEENRMMLREGLCYDCFPKLVGNNECTSLGPQCSRAQQASTRTVSQLISDTSGFQGVVLVGIHTQTNQQDILPCTCLELAGFTRPWSPPDTKSCGRGSTSS